MPTKKKETVKPDNLYILNQSSEAALTRAFAPLKGDTLLESRQQVATEYIVLDDETGLVPDGVYIVLRVDSDHPDEALIRANRRGARCFCQAVSETHPRLAGDLNKKLDELKEQPLAKPVAHTQNKFACSIGNPRIWSQECFTQEELAGLLDQLAAFPDAGATGDLPVFGFAEVARLYNAYRKLKRETGI